MNTILIQEEQVSIAPEHYFSRIAPQIEEGREHSGFVRPVQRLTPGSAIDRISPRMRLFASGPAPLLLELNRVGQGIDERHCSEVTPGRKRPAL